MLTLFLDRFGGDVLTAKTDRKLAKMMTLLQRNIPFFLALGGLGLWGHIL